MGLAQVRIILMEPAGALNVGSVARVMKNFDLNRLILVNPQCDIGSEEARHMAVRGRDVLANAQIVPNLAAALVGCHRAVATTGRDDRIPFALYRPRQLFPQISQLLHRSPFWEVALIFGREDRGLTHSELNQAHQILTIASSDRYPSLNLAQAVGICCYELFEAFHTLSEPLAMEQSAESALELPRPLQDSSKELAEELPQNDRFDRVTHRGLPASEVPLPATLEVLEGYYQHLESVLLQIGYLYPHTTASRMEKFRQIYQRAGLADPEVFLLRGILRQTEWALRNR